MPDDPPILLDRDMVIDAMTELVATLRERGVAAGIRLVGGAAISIQYNHDRPPTTDVDAFLYPGEEILEVAAEMTVRRGWKPGWLNDKALAFTTHHDTPQDWTVILDDEDAVVSVASAELLFAMKANASRGVRDGRDLLTLADVCEITTIDQAEEVFERYFPQDVMKAKGVRWLQAHFRGEDPFDV
jgi:hypothetical protein